MKRREFLSLMGMSAAAVSFGLVSDPTRNPASTLTVAELEAEFRPADLFTIAGRYAVNPVTGQPTQFLQYFIVTNVSADVISFTPDIAGKCTGKVGDYFWPKGIDWKQGARAC